MATKHYVQPFTWRPANEEEAMAEVIHAQKRYDDAIKEYQKYLYSGKPGVQRRDNQVKWAEKGLENAKADLKQIRNPEPTLFP